MAAWEYADHHKPTASANFASGSELSTLRGLLEVRRVALDSREVKFDKLGPTLTQKTMILE